MSSVNQLFTIFVQWIIKNPYYQLVELTFAHLFHYIINYPRYVWKELFQQNGPKVVPQLSQMGLNPKPRTRTKNYNISIYASILKLTEFQSNIENLHLKYFSFYEVLLRTDILTKYIPPCSPRWSFEENGRNKWFEEVWQR